MNSALDDQSSSLTDVVRSMVPSPLSSKVTVMGMPLPAQLPKLTNYSSKVGAVALPSKLPPRAGATIGSTVDWVMAQNISSRSTVVSSGCA